MRNISPSFCFAVLLAVCALAASCTKEQEPPGLTQTVEPEFSVRTRTTLNGYPEHGDTYTLISFNVGGTSSTEAFKNQISDSRYFGYYAYDDGVLSGREPGTLVPVSIKAPVVSDITPYDTTKFYRPSAGIAPLVIDKTTSAQRLAAAPQTGLNPANNTGLYRTAVIYPAIPVINSSAGLGYLAVYHIDTRIWASSPDDADGDPATVDPFEILVNTNAKVHPLPQKTELYPIRSAVGVWFYSEYFAEDDIEMINPKSQTFSITSLKLVNVGSNGWFNARTGIVYPNYNYGLTPTSGNYSGGDWYNVYSASEIGVNPDGTPIYKERGAYNFADLKDPNHDGNCKDSLIVDESGNNILPPPRPGYPEPTKYIQWSAEVPVFPSDYRGAENGGLTEVKPLSLRMELKVGPAPLKATVPIALLMERGKKYNFYINVMSEMIVIKYNVSEWDDGGKSTGDIGGTTLDYMEISIKYKPGGWIVGGGGTHDIGS